MEETTRPGYKVVFECMEGENVVCVTTNQSGEVWIQTTNRIIKIDKEG